MTQADKIIARFGGVKELAQAIGRTAVTVHRWKYPRDRGGTDGNIPTSAIAAVMAAARARGLEFQPHDWTPDNE